MITSAILDDGDPLRSNGKDRPDLGGCGQRERVGVRGCGR